MNSKTEISKDIIRLESIITRDFPELLKYLGEMPVKISYEIDNDISIKNLKDYFNSLNELINHYSLSHKNNSSIK